MSKLRQTLRKAGKLAMSKDNQLPIRTRPLPEKPKIKEVKEPEVEVTPQESRRKSTEFVDMEITGSKGKKYKVAVPIGYSKLVPRVWEWTEKRYRVADMIAEGIPYTDIAASEDIHRNTIYGWLEHPEFREHVDGLVMESGFANRRERIAKLNALTNKLSRKIVNELDTIRLNEKSIGAILTAIGQYAKHLAQEKEEFVEQSKVEQDTTLNGKLDVAHINVNEVLNNASDEERKRLEEEFDQVADEIIRGITGDKE